VAELLKFKMRYGRPHVLVQWTGRDASGDTWEPLENLTNCEDTIAAFERASGRTLPQLAPRPPLAVGPPPPPPTPPRLKRHPLTPAGFTVDAAPPPDFGAALVGRQLLFWWLDDGWQPERGTVARLCQRPAFSHVVAYNLPTSALCGTRNRCLTPPPMAPGGCCCPPPPGRPLACGAAPDPTHDFRFGLCLVTAWAEPDDLTRARPLDAESSRSRSRRLAPFPGLDSNINRWGASRNST
jgi:hypothetical protein